MDGQLTHVLSYFTYRHPHHLSDTTVLDSDSLWLPTQDTFLLEKTDSGSRDEKVRTCAYNVFPRAVFLADRFSPI